MPTGPFGGPRPLADCELMYTARYNIASGIGTRLEGSQEREQAEKLIAQRIDENTDYREPAVKLNPAGWTLAVDVMLGSDELTPDGFSHLRSAVDDAVKQAVDENAKRGESIDMPEWSVRSKG